MSNLKSTLALLKWAVPFLSCFSLGLSTNIICFGIRLIVNVAGDIQGGSFKREPLY